MHALVYLDCSFTRCYTLVDEAKKCRQFSLKTSEWPDVASYLTETCDVFPRKSIRNRRSLEALNQF